MKHASYFSLTSEHSGASEADMVVMVLDGGMKDGD